MTKEDLYPSTSYATGVAGACDRGRLERVDSADKVQLTGGGFQTLQQWSATALQQVRAGEAAAGARVAHAGHGRSSRVDWARSRAGP